MRKIKNIIINNLHFIIPLTLYFIFCLIMNFLVKNKLDDVEMFYKGIEDLGGYNLQNIFKFLGNRYNTLTSRLGVEFWLVTLVRTPILFRILNSIVLTMLAFFLMKIFNNRKLWFNFLLLSLIMITNYKFYTDVGITATCTNYLWPLCFASLSFFSLIKIYKTGKPNMVAYSISIALLVLYSLWVEMVCFIVGFFSVVCLTLLLAKNKKINYYTLTYVILAAIFSIYIITCPGNKCRAGGVDPGFSQLSFITKTNRSITIGFFGLFNQAAPQSLIFVIALPIYCFVNNQKNKYKILSLSICLIYMITILLFDSDNNYVKSNINNAYYGAKWYFTIIMSILILLILFILYKVISSETRYIIISCFALCFCTIAMLGFTHQIYIRWVPRVMYISNCLFIFINSYLISKSFKIDCELLK